MDATRNEYLLASMVSELVSRAKTIEYYKGSPEYKIEEHYSLKLDEDAVDLLLQFCNEYASSINADLWVSIPTEAGVKIKNLNLKESKEKAESEGN